MSKLIECSMCEKMISPNAVSCPHCDEPQIFELTEVGKKDTSVKSKKALVATAIVVAILIVVFLTFDDAMNILLAERSSQVSPKPSISNSISNSDTESSRSDIIKGLKITSVYAYDNELEFKVTNYTDETFRYIEFDIKISNKSTGEVYDKLYTNWSGTFSPYDSIKVDKYLDYSSMYFQIDVTVSDYSLK